MLYVIGAGPGDPELLTVKALKALEACEILAGWRSVVDRVIRGYPRLAGKEIVYLTYGNQEAELRRLAAEAGRREVCVLAHGDPVVSDWEFLGRIKNAVGRFELINGVSSLNVALGALGLDMAHIVFVTMHASSPQDPIAVAKCLVRERAFVIFPPPRGSGPAEVARSLLSAGLAGCKAWVLEELTVGDKVWSGALEELADAPPNFSDLSIVVVDCRGRG